MYNVGVRAFEIFDGEEVKSHVERCSLSTRPHVGVG